MAGWSRAAAKTAGENERERERKKKNNVELALGQVVVGGDRRNVTVDP